MVDTKEVVSSKMSSHAGGDALLVHTASLHTANVEENASHLVKHPIDLSFIA